MESNNLETTNSLPDSEMMTLTCDHSATTRVLTLSHPKQVTRLLTWDLETLLVESFNCCDLKQAKRDRDRGCDGQECTGAWIGVCQQYAFPVSHAHMGKTDRHFKLQAL